MILAPIDPPAKGVLQIGCGTQVIGMHMGFDDPVQCQALVANIGNDLICAVIGDAPGGIVDVHYAIDDRKWAIRLLYNIADRIGCSVEKSTLGRWSCRHWQSHRWFPPCSN